MTDERNMAGEMAGLFESAFMLGLGVLGTTRDKVTEATDELIERGRMSKTDATKMADRVVEAAGEQQDALRRIVAEETRKALAAAGLATRAELDALRAELAELRAEVARSGGGGVR